MPLPGGPPKRSPSTIFVLWGDKFEESAVVTFTTTLRAAGLQVKLVGLTGQRSSGQYGLMLHSDLALGEALALARQARCVIVPCGAAVLKRVENDPRLLDFFQQAVLNDACFVINDRESWEWSSLPKWVTADNKLIFYSEYPDLQRCAQEVAHALCNLTAHD